MKNSVLLMLICGALLSSCGNGSVADSTQTASNVTIQYKKYLLPLVVGTYSGKCKKQPEMEPIDGLVNINAQGQISGGGAQKNLLDQDAHFVFSRERREDGTMKAQYIGGSVNQDWVFGFESGSGDTAALRLGENGIVCEESPAVARLKDQSLVTPLVQFLVHAPVELMCLKPDKSVVYLKYEVNTTKGSLGDLSFVFGQSLAKESISAAEPSIGGQLTYMLVTFSNQTFEINLDEKGNLVVIAAKVGDAIDYVCTPKS